jgi:solute carrier family 25 protein 39/40
MAPASAPTGCLQPSKWAGIWGEPVTYEEALARGSKVTIPGSPPGGFWNEVMAVKRETGVRGLWKGVGTTL